MGHSESEEMYLKTIRQLREEKECVREPILWRSWAIRKVQSLSP